MSIYGIVTILVTVFGIGDGICVYLRDDTLLLNKNIEKKKQKYLINSEKKECMRSKKGNPFSHNFCCIFVV